MIKTVRFAAACLLAASPFAVGFAAEPAAAPGPAAPVIERAPDSYPTAARTEIATLRREKEQLVAELALARKTAETLQANLAGTTAAKAENDTALKDSTRELAVLRAKVARLEPTAANPAATADAVREKARADEAIARLNTLTSALDKMLPEKTALEAQLAEARHRVTTLQSDNDLLKAASADQVRLTAELEKVRREKAAATPAPDLAAKLAETEEKLAASLRSYSLVQTENDQLKTAAGNHDALADDLEKARQENAGLKTRLAATPAPAPDHAPDLSAKLAETEAKLSTVLRSFSQLQTENDRLKAEAAGAAEKSQSLFAQAAGDSAARIAALFDELRQANARAAALAGEISRLKTRFALAGPPPGSTLAVPVRPGTPPAGAPGDPTAAPAPAADEPAPAAAPRTHVVVAGDTLAKIARQAYGNANRWDEILRANRDVLKNENVLPIGATLRIP